MDFRKKPIAADVTHVIVYATQPIGAVVGVFTVEAQYTLNPHTLWRRFRSVAGIGWRDFMAYYAGRPFGTGITVGQVFAAPAQMCLRDDLGIAHPPQSFQYLDCEAATALLTTMRPKS